MAIACRGYNSDTQGNCDVVCQRTVYDNTRLQPQINVSAMLKNALLISILSITILLAGCGGTPFWLPKAHKIDIQQGNLISAEVISSLKTGMTRQEVTTLLGEPVLDNGLNPDRWDYLYTKGEAGEHVIAETLAVFFEDDKVVDIDNNYTYDANKKR